MPEQPSILDEDKIKAAVFEKYGVTVRSVAKLAMGTANCYRISDGAQSYFLKEFQSRFTSEDLRRETELTDYLLQNVYPTARILKTKDGNRFFSYESNQILLQEWVDGKTYDDNNLPHHLLMEAAEVLGKLHHILNGYELPLDMGPDWINSFTPEKSAVQYDELLAALENQKGDPNYERIQRDLLYKKHLTYRIASFNRYYDDITYCATHGDFTCVQYICDDEHIKAIIDFSSARKLPVSWEIMRSYIQSSNSCKDGANFDMADFCEYVLHYLKFTSLTKTDLQNMPYVYLYQLARSKYGYKEYLITNTENKNDLLNFAFWRTDICREIEKRKEEIADKLCLLAAQDRRSV